MPQKNTAAFITFKHQTPIKLLGACLLLICLLSGFSSCKKAIEQQQKNIIVQAITTGHWYVQLYKDGAATDLTSNFSLYEFQFYENGTVDGIKNNVTVSTGTWSADTNNYTIFSSFPSSANDTLKLLNYTWKITDSGLDYVKAKTPTSSGDNILNLKKK